MFTRRQAIRWAELWLSCWNEGDYDTLLALYKNTARFERTRGRNDPGSWHADKVEGLKRHWAALPFGIHSLRGELERVAWDPETRELTIVYLTNIDGTRLHGCDLVTLDPEGRVLLGEPCVGCLAENEPTASTGVLVQSKTQRAQGGR